jgi:hypothetical protein
MSHWLATLVSICTALTALAQETEIQGWTAPPYWAPPASAHQPDIRDTHPVHGRILEGRQALAGGPTALPFISLFPCRLVDTRGNGAPLTDIGFLAQDVETLLGEEYTPREVAAPRVPDGGIEPAA